MKNRLRASFLFLGDIAAFFLAFIGMIFVAFPKESRADMIKVHMLPFFFLSLAGLLTFFIFNLYDTEASKPTIPHLQKIANAFIVFLIVSIVSFYIFSFWKITPKTNLLIFVSFLFLIFLTWRRIFYNIFSIYFLKNIAFIVSEEKNLSLAQDLVKYIRDYPQSGFYVSNIYYSVEEFLDSKTSLPHMLIVAKEIWKDTENFKKLYFTKCVITNLASAHEDILGNIPVETIDEDWFVHNIHSRAQVLYESTKRILSFIISLFLIILSLPFLLFIGICIKIYDGGPIFYSQVRVGKNGKNFKLHKLRSMAVNSEENGPQWSVRADTRVTPIGKYLRILHLDEIPQMWNIMKGDISLVGPRPERPEFVELLTKEIPFYEFRHIITPGFTGWAQIKFRYAGNILDSKKKFEYDLYYIKNRNIFMDLGIMLRTLQIIFTH